MFLPESRRGAGAVCTEEEKEDKGTGAGPNPTFFNALSLLLRSI